MIANLKQASTLLAILLCSPLSSQAQDTAPEATVQSWVAAFNDCNAEKLSSLYDVTATLWGTNSPALATSADAVRSYFDRACSVQPPLKVTLGQVVARAYGTSATVSGTYEFTRSGSAFPARYSFTLQQRPDGWRIVQHHSSPLPARP
jgi:hypothetical protein